MRPLTDDEDERASEVRLGSPPAGPFAQAAGGEPAKLAEALDEFLAAWEAEHGSLTKEELTAAGLRLGLEARTTGSHELERERRDTARAWAEDPERREALAEMSQAVREDGGFLGRFAPSQDDGTAVPTDAMSVVENQRDVARHAAERLLLDVESQHGTISDSELHAVRTVWPPSTTGRAAETHDQSHERRT